MVVRSDEDGVYTAVGLQPQPGFAGPIFIIGMSRSGTKLLRNLLNQHSEIAILQNESHFIPYYHRRFSKFGDISQPRNFDAFYRDVSRSALFQRLRDADEGVGRDDWYGQIQDWSYAGVIRAFLGCYAKMKGKPICGDKTPSYLCHIPLLSELFPEARFIHILRDPRDYCVSINRAWGKNVFRAAQRWNDDVRICRGDAAHFLEDRGDLYLEIKYEDLLAHPRETMNKICRFLSIRFENAMLSLDRPAENLGDTKRSRDIVRDNSGKWRQRLRPSEVEAIEHIAGATMSAIGYSTSFPEGEYRVKKWRMAAYKALDGVRLLYCHICRNRNIWKTLRWVILERTHSAYRN